MQKKKSKKQSLVRQVAFILGTYEGGTVEQNLPLAKYIVAHVKRHLTKRPPDSATPELKGSVLVTSVDGVIKTARAIPPSR